MNKEKEIEEMAHCIGTTNFLCAEDCDNCIQIRGKCNFIKYAKALYNAGYRKVEQGKWIVDFNNPYRRRKVKCSVCGEYSGIGGNRRNQDKSYCPNCGAKIDNLIKGMTEEQK
jgi:hypothetical protein